MGTERGGTCACFMRLIQQVRDSLIRMSLHTDCRSRAAGRVQRPEAEGGMLSELKSRVECTSWRREAGGVCCMCAFVRICARELRGLVGQGERLCVLV